MGVKAETQRKVRGAGDGGEEGYVGTAGIQREERGCGGNKGGGLHVHVCRERRKQRKLQVKEGSVWERPH